MSDVKLHGLDFGKLPVMLYRVKWKGYEKITREPISSFDNLSVVYSYRAKGGLDEVGSRGNDEDGDREMD